LSFAAACGLIASLVARDSPVDTFHFDMRRAIPSRTV
jgi:hypothetical protein